MRKIIIDLNELELGILATALALQRNKNKNLCDDLIHTRLVEKIEDAWRNAK